ncbi:hypothetical protein PRIPAC_75280 [Pristionchus pacificus]|uniref:Uncharacterized protein n=1 Tax=Pristionchus pacificus TaxID=54126 RepID=A0A2A6D0F6_PRIPA|nr:hypothetical protein PRIPAC_75280 [Pristionchus pacificus]|eukprot:PDM83885.1 hypothetical protein PRIPAC_30372 [Pristionchus pacificus]
MEDFFSNVEDVNLIPNHFTPLIEDRSLSPPSRRISTLATIRSNSIVVLSATDLVPKPPKNEERTTPKKHSLPFNRLLIFSVVILLVNTNNFTIQCVCTSSTELRFETSLLVLLAVFAFSNLICFMRKCQRNRKWKRRKYIVATEIVVANVLNVLSIIVLLVIGIHGGITLYSRMNTDAEIWKALIVLLILTIIEFDLFECFFRYRPFHNESDNLEIQIETFMLLLLAVIFGLFMLFHYKLIGKSKTMLAKMIFVLNILSIVLLLVILIHGGLTLHSLISGGNNVWIALIVLLALSVIEFGIRCYLATKYWDIMNNIEASSG